MNNIKTGRLALFITLLFASSAAISSQDNGDGQDNIWDFRVLQNSSTEDCAYMHDVALRIKYTLESTDEKDIVITGADSEGFQGELTRKTVEHGNGEVIMMFDAGDCLTDINIDME